MKSFRATFHVGIGLGVAILITSVLSPWLAAVGDLFRAELSVAYLGLSLAHVALLSIQGFRLDHGYARAAAETLYTVGFLHTLMALGLAVVLSGTLLAGQQSFTLQTLGVVLFPMGSALVPHAVGVWMGNELASRHQDVFEAVEDSVLKQLTEDAEAARGVIQELFRRREELLRQQTESLREQAHLFGQMKEHLTVAMSVATRTLEDFVKTTHDASKQIGGGLIALAEAVEVANHPIQALKKELEVSVGQVKAFHAGIRDTSEVIKDLNTLHRAIVDLLSSDLFKSRRVKE